MKPALELYTELLDRLAALEVKVKDLESPKIEPKEEVKRSPGRPRHAE